MRVVQGPALARLPCQLALVAACLQLDLVVCTWARELLLHVVCPDGGRALPWGSALLQFCCAELLRPLCCHAVLLLVSLLTCLVPLPAFAVFLVPLALHGKGLSACSSRVRLMLMG